MRLFPTDIAAKMNRFAAKLAIAFLFVSVLAFEQAHADATIDRPNVLFIAVDDLNDWVGCLGGHPQAKTPNIDRLASRGVLFEQAYCSAPLCNPSRTATMTGLQASTIGIWNNEGRYGRSGAVSWFRDKPEFKDWVTIPQYFRRHGYTAVAGGKIFHKPQGKFSDRESWDHQYSTEHGTPFPRNGKRLLHGMSDKFTHEYFKDWADWQPLDIPESETADWKTAEGAAAFLRRDHDKPFFLACGIFRPHLRWYAPRKYFDMHPLEKIKLPVCLENDLDDLPPRGRRQNSAGSQAFGVIREHGEWKKAVQGYLASCSFADACVGVVLDALEESEYAENTIVVLWSDHGYHVGEKDRISKLTLWEQGAKTPLIISDPGLPATRGKRCKRPVSLVDLYPTLVELCGLPARDGLDGRSLAPLVRKPETEWQYPAVISLQGDHAVRSQRWHYIRYADGGEELYDAAKDPHQWKNLATDTRFANAKTKLKKWLPRNKAERSGSNATRSETAKKSRQSHKPEVSAASTANTSRKCPNVVTLLVDDLGYRDLGCYGGPVKTPVLDKLAAGGVRFTDFHSGAPSCSPSRATFLTGRHHYRAGVYSVISERLHKMHLLKSEKTIAEVLKDNGYATAHFGKWHLGMSTGKRENLTPADHGFDYWFGLVNGAQPNHKDPVNFLRNGERAGPMKGYSCQIVVDEALTWLDEKRAPDAPFFLNLWFNEPHAVIAAPDEVVSQYGALDDQAAIYNGTIDNTDRAIGRLVAKLEKLGELDNTIIVYSSDNGSYLQERSGELRGKKGSQFEGGHRVPGIFHWKGGIPGGRVEDEPAGAVDLLPTLCGLTGIEKPGGVHLDGSDLAPLLTRSGKFERHQPLFWMSQASMAMRMADHTLFTSGTAKSPIDFKTADRLMKQVEEVLGDDLEKELGGLDLRSRMFNGRFANPEANRLQKQHRDLYYFNEAWIPELKKSGIGGVRLFDLSKDLGQQNDIAKEHPELVARMKKQATAIYRSVMADAPEWLTPKELAAAKKPRRNAPQRPAAGTSKTADLLARIDKNPLPKGYHGSRHQPYVDRVMAGLNPVQRALVGQLWKDKRRLDPNMPDRGASFVRILTHVAGAAGKSKQPNIQTASKPNVVILLADDLGSQDLGCYGGPVKTPALDGLAARGVRFTDFHAGAAVCSPSRATLLTGRQNLRTGIYGVLQDHWHNMHLLEREVTIAEVLQEAGYGTAHFGKWHIGMTSGKRKKPSLKEHGFDYWFGLSNGAQPSHKDPVNFLRNGKRVGPLKGYSCQLIVDDAIRWLDQKESPDQPFFLNLWFNEPHSKLAAPDEIVSLYGDIKDEAALYSATIDNTDRAIGRLVAKLKDMGQLDNTLIIYSSDHGSYRADRNGGLKGAKGSNFQGGLRSPGIFFWPDGIRGGRTESTSSGSVDLLPTLCGLAGIDKPKGVHLDGADLSPLLTEKGKFERAQPMFWLAPTSGHLATLREGRYTLMGYRGYKLPQDHARRKELMLQMAKLAGIDPSTPNLGSRVTNTTFTSPEYKRLKNEFVRARTFQESWIPIIKKGGFSRFALYDLENDPLQEEDISRKRPKVTARLKEKLLELYRDVLDDAPDWGPVDKSAAILPRQPVEALVEASCIECHDADTKTAMNFDELGFDLANADAFRRWEKVFDKIESGEMPPERKPRPDPKYRKGALDSLRRHLRDTSLATQKTEGRAPARRLTRNEYEHTLHDLLGIGGDLASKLPPENASSTFDTIASDQGISSVHIRSYLAAADAAIDEAIELGRKPRMGPQLIDYRNNPYVRMWFDRELRRGGNTVLRADDAFVLFDGRQQRSPHSNQSNNMGIRFPVPGRYRIVAEAYAYQARTPVTFCLYRANDRAAKKELIGSWQLDPGEPRQVEVEHYFQPGDYFFLAPSDLDATARGRDVMAVGARKYKGEGVAVRRLTLEGPLERQWPPERTRELLGAVEFRAGRDGEYAIILRDEPLARVADVVSRIGPRAFRRPLGNDELASWAAKAKPVLAEGRGFEEALRVVLRAMFSSPEFLYHSAEPGRLDDYALATRLSCFLWKSLPDDQLFLLAAEGKLGNSAVLASEVDRLLADEKSQRFVEDFLDQWLELEDIDATRPDARLYPEYDDVLRQAMLEETRRFFSELIWRDLGVRELIDSEFTFLNRRLAVHYGIPDIEGLEFQKVRLPDGSPRGGILTQASVLKVTANGTNTSPVPRGSFVLSRLLGTPPSSPPPGVGSIDPDTRGATTIREELAAHRNVESCARCHRDIDPPGFSLESFDAIGGFRTRYRSTGKGDWPTARLFGRRIREYRLGQPVDASGTLVGGAAFSDIREFKRLLLKKEELVARHLLRQLVAYATGAEIQFADREELNRILRETRAQGHGVRGMIHAVVQSRMFRNK